MTEKEAFRENLQSKIVSDIVLLGDSGAAIHKWRDIFNVSQRDLADKIGVKSSIISDYELGRRKSPGAAMIKKIAEAFSKIDAESSGVASENIVLASSTFRDSIIDTRKLLAPKTVEDIRIALNGTVVARAEDTGTIVSAYTIIDSMRAIVSFSPAEFSEIYEHVSGKAAVFIGAERGRSSLVAMKVANIKPSIVIFHGMKELDKVAERIAISENIPVILSGMKTVDELVAALNTI